MGHKNYSLMVCKTVSIRAPARGAIQVTAMTQTKWIKRQLSSYEIHAMITSDYLPWRIAPGGSRTHKVHRDRRISNPLRLPVPPPELWNPRR